MRTIIQNGTVVTSEAVFKADVEIKGEIITALGTHIHPKEGDRVIDATGQYIFPGGVDVHTHMANEESPDDVKSASKAAAMGGTTSMIIMTGTNKGESLLESVQNWKEKAKTSLIDYSFHPIIRGSHFTEERLDEIPLLSEQEGITSIKMFMAYKDGSMVNDTTMYKVMKKAAQSNIISCIHAENGDLIDELVQEAILKGNTDPIYHAHSRPPIVEAEATARALSIAEVANAPVYIVHVSCSEALEHVERAKSRGVKVWAETCPHYLVFDIESLNLPQFEGAKYVCSPPLREKFHQDILWQGINENLISTIGSDHSPNLFNGQKSKGKHDFSKIKNGVPGIEDRFAVMYHFGVYEGRMTLEKFVDVMSTTPAKLFGIPNKGSITIGYDADIVIFDPDQSRIITQRNQYQKSDYNIYEGMNIQGVMTHVLSRGEVISIEGKYVGKSDRGRFIRRH